MTVFVLIQPGWTWAPLLFVIAITAVSTIAANGDLPGGHGRGSGLSGAATGGAAGGAAWPEAPGIMAVVSYLTPPSW